MSEQWLTDRRAGVVVLLAALLAYGAACCGTFVFDDLHSVRDNPHLRSLANVSTFFVDPDAFSALNNRMYRPVLLTSFALNHAVADLAAWFYKLTNVLIHAGVAWTLFAVARAMRASTAAALVAGLLFAVHPLASEAVNLVSGRSELLVVGFLLTGVWAHLGAMRGNARLVVASSACCALACGSKETGVVLPALLVVLEVLGALRGRLDVRGAMLRVAPVAAVAVAYLAVRRELFGVATAAMPVLHGGTDPLVGATRDLVTQYSTMAVLLPRSLAQVVVPIGLSLDPWIPYQHSPWSPPVLAGLALVTILTGLGLRRPRERPYAVFATCFVWAIAAPWVLLPLNQPLAEHRLYGPLVGFALLLAVVLPRDWRPARATQAALAGIVIVFASLSTLRSLEYRDEAILWRGVLNDQPYSVRGLCGLATCEATAGRLAEAERLVAAALLVYPEHRPAQRNLAEFNLQMPDGDPFVAIVMAEALLEHEVDNPFHLLLLARAFAAAGDRTGEARFYARGEATALRCLEVAEPKALVYRTAADIRGRAGDLEGALRLLEDALERGLDHYSVWLDRHALLLRLGRRQQAEAALGQAMRRAPFEPAVQAALQAFPAAPR